MIKVNGDQLRDFSEHVAACKQCRGNIIAAWSVSADVTDSLDGLCLDGAVLLGARVMQTGAPSS